MLMNTPVHCLEGLLVSRVDEQQMHWLTEWISNMSLFFGGGACAKHTADIASDGRLCQWSNSLSLFQPKTATIEDIAIALLKICLFAVWR